MTKVLIIISAIAAVFYIYAAIAFYKAFRDWNPLCGCKGTSCAPRKIL